MFILSHQIIVWWLSSGENGKDVIQLCRCKMGNPKKSSVFICLKCLDWKFTYIQGIQRSNQRELGHIKDNVCNRCGEIYVSEE